MSGLLITLNMTF